MSACLSLGFGSLITVTHLHLAEHLEHSGLVFIEHVGKQLKRLTLVFLLRVLLRITTQPDALAKVIHTRQMLLPVLIERL